MRLWISAFSAITFGACFLHAQEPGSATYLVDLPTVLRLAGAQNLDIQIAQERRKEALANQTSAVEGFFPWLSPGIAYHRRDGMTQAVPAGTVSESDFQSYAPGAAVAGQVDFGSALYKSLEAKQLVKASDHAFETQRQDSILSAAQGYFDLTRAKALVGVARESLKYSQDYQQELHEAVASGIAFKGDEIRIQTESERYQIALRQALEHQRIAAANLADILHLDPTVELVPQDDGLTPITLFASDVPISDLVQHALINRPEIKQSGDIIAASRAAKDGAVYGPLIPTLGTQVFAGGYGGGHTAQPSNFGGAEDSLVSLSWRIGPGGLFDSGRINASKAQLAATSLGDAKLKDAIATEVVVSDAHMQSVSDQIALAKLTLASASETLRLTGERRQFGVGIVLEYIQAEQALDQARSDYFTVIAEYNKAQYGLNKAVGGPPEAEKIPRATK